MKILHIKKDFWNKKYLWRKLDPCAYNMLLKINNNDSLHGSFVHNIHPVISEILYLVYITT